ncbi:glutamine synthetase family protein [Endozoicomonas ascidiicola]|uniref:glutamine synthetase family protein n=1 Tax=Endozoicomonas ascidiicola TaxID=1698521 RepID=UPI00083171C8|nr:glutamine synthetase family protein [Endozoicomonas ascidiicola]
MPKFTEELADYLERYPQTEYIDTLLPDINGFVRGKRLPASSFKKIENGCYLPCSVFSLDITGVTIEEAGLGMTIGEPDNLCLPLLGTLAPSATDPEKIAQVFLTMVNEEGSDFPYEPRNVLKPIVERFNGLGLNPVVALELEFYLVDPERNKEGTLQPPIGCVSGVRETMGQVYSVDGLGDFAGFLNDVNQLAKSQGVPADSAVAEAAPGQFEINLKHGDDPLAACDHAIMLKRLIREVAARYNYEATFMAKPYEEHPGNGLHIHVSLQDDVGENVFANSDGEDSVLLRQAIAGSIELMPETVALLCPNVNSYRRLVPDMYVPLQACWGHNNRTVSLRIPVSGREDRRIEHRVAGADANPYLTLASVLAGMLYGIENELVPPAEALPGADNDMPLLPHRPADALSRLAGNQLLKHYIPQSYIDLYTVCKRAELQQFESHITALETSLLLKTA